MIITQLVRFARLLGRMQIYPNRQVRTRTHRYIKLIVSSGIMLQKNIYPTIAAKLGIGLEDAHVRFSRNCSIEKIIAILRGILDNNNISYYAGTIETSAYRPSDTEMIGQK